MKYISSLRVKKMGGIAFQLTLAAMIFTGCWLVGTWRIAWGVTLISTATSLNVRAQAERRGRMLNELEAIRLRCRRAGIVIDDYDQEHSK